MENKVIYAPVEVQTEFDVEATIKYIKEIRNYFGEHDKTQQEHSLFAKCSRVINFLETLKKVELPSEEEIEEAVNSFDGEPCCRNSYSHGIENIISIINQKK